LVTQNKEQSTKEQRTKRTMKNKKNKFRGGVGGTTGAGSWNYELRILTRIALASSTIACTIALSENHLT
jgi:hypothetical protein